jgi:transcriptional regulator with GAF, ATPase, and Fis domain
MIDLFSMSVSHPLSRALGAAEAGILRETGANAVGFALAPQDRFMRFELRHRVTASAIFVRPSDVPAVLRPPLGGPQRLLTMAGAVEAGTPVARFMAMFGLTALCAVPLDGGALFTAYETPDAAAAADLGTLARLAREMAERAAGPEPAEVEQQRLERVDRLADMLPVLSSALDVRELFDHLSAVVRRVLPHDLAVVGLLEDGGRKVRLHALTGVPDLVLPETIDNPYPEAFDGGWGFAIHRHLLEHPYERSRETVRWGARSSVRVPILMEGQVGGVLNLSSFSPDAFSDADVPIAERIADAVMLAISHQRLADEARHAEAMRERAANLEVLEQLLDTLAGALDVREVLGRLSAIARKVLPHDAMSVPIILDDPPRLRVHALSGFDHMPALYETAMPEPRLISEPWDHLLLNFGDRPEYASSPTAQAGMQSVLCLPIRFDGRLYASVNFYSRRKNAFSPHDVLVGRRITDHIALAFSHQRLLEETRQAADLNARAASLELLDELLAAETHEGELDEVFDRVSAIAQQVIPHDTMLLPVALPDGKHARIYARGGADATAFPDVVEIPETLLEQPGWEYEIIDDLPRHAVQRYLTAAKLGYRSALRVPVQLEGRYAGALVFFSAEPAKYTPPDVMAARRIADRVTLVLARDRGAAAARRADEANARAAKLEARVRALTEELDARTGLRRVIGESATWRQALVQATRVAATETNVLLLGESGTGKEIVARFVHRASDRSGRPFIALNCAALPEHMLEAELFGYERGAFTGAVQSKPGQLEQAAGGTLFLDEVGEMSLPAQAKLLRVLQEREFQRLGGTRVIKSDARIIAATNRNLETAIRQNTFREDLYYRLNVFAIQLPPLRERRDDLVALTDAFLAEIGRSFGRPPAGISAEARARLADYEWPGNVRELRNVLERAAILCDGGTIQPAHLALAPAPRPLAEAAASRPPEAAAPPAPPSRPRGGEVADPPARAAGDLESVERTVIARELEKARYNKSKAAKALGLTRAQLYVRLRRYGLE